MKTRRGYQGNVLLVEMIVVLLFFSLSAVISMGVFVTARQMVDQAALLTAANERMSAWAEELALTPEVEEYLAAQGFSRQADGWTLSGEEAVYTAQATVQPTGAGTRTQVTLEARDAHGNTLTSLTAGGYFGGEERP